MVTMAATSRAALYDSAVEGGAPTHSQKVGPAVAAAAAGAAVDGLRQAARSRAATTSTAPPLMRSQ